MCLCCQQAEGVSLTHHRSASLAPSQVRHLQMLRNEISILKVVGEALVC